ncbi:MAG: efflux RND transporter permease subunit, partial [Planctomycetota bacterium]
MLASRRWLVGAEELAKGEADLEADSGLAPRDTSGRPARPLLAGLEWRLGLIVPNLLTIFGRLLAWIIGSLAMIVMALAKLIYLVMSYVLLPVRWVFEFFWGTVERSYPPLLKASLRMPLLVLLAAAALSVWAASRVPELGVQLLPEIHQGEFTAHVGLGVGTPLAETDRTMRQLEREIASHEDVAVTALVVGVEEETLSREIEGEHTARLTVRMREEISNPDREEVLLNHVRRLLLDRPEVRTLDFTRPTPFALESPIAVEVKGHDLDQLEELAGEVAERMKRLPELSDVRTTLRPGHPEARVVFDRDKTLEYGLDLRATATLVRDQLLGNVSTRFVEGDERIDVRVLGDEDILDSLQSVMSLVVNPSSEAAPIPLEAIASVDIVRGPAEIRRIGNTRAIVVGA